MGCDGGTIPKRHELVRTKQKPEEKDRDSDRVTTWQYCSLTNQRLKEPIVACELGRLYNKDAIIEFLLNKDTSDKPEKMDHIKGLKDIHTLKLSENPAYIQQQKKGDGYLDMHMTKYYCPIAGINMNGKYRFSFLLTCKCVISNKALDQIRDGKCPICSVEYSKDAIIPLNENKTVVERLRANMFKRKEEAKQKKLEKKKKKLQKQDGNNGKEDEPSTSSSVECTSSSVKNKKKTKKREEISSDRVRNLTNTSLANNAKHKLIEDKLYQSDAFKSLFTSHPTAKRAKDKNGHWITYNPYHYSG